MTEQLEQAIQHIKTRADAWAVKEVTEALQSISERLNKALSQEPCEKCEVGNPCLYCKHDFEPQESEEISERNMKMWEAIFKTESGDKE